MFRFTDYGEEDAIRLCKELVRIESTDPGSYEGRISEYIYETLRQELGADGVRLCRSEVLTGRRNLLAELPGSSALAGSGKEEPALVLICHMDTVVAGEGWSEETGGPFSAAERDGRIYGRGSCDMKSGLACALTAFCREAGERRLRQGEKAPEKYRTLRFIASVDEEDFMRGAERVIRDGWVSASDWVMDLEPTDGRIQNCHKGRVWFEAEAEGVTAHASMPEQGTDAILALSYFICALREEVAKLPEDERMGRTTITFGQITGGYRPYVVPDHAKVWIDLRTVPPTDSRMLRELLGRAERAATEKVPGSKFRILLTGDRQSIPPCPKSRLLQSLRQAVREATGEEAVVSLFPGYTDTAVIAGTLGNENCLSYGPGKLRLAHKPNEYVDISDIRRVMRVLRCLLREPLR